MLRKKLLSSLAVILACVFAIGTAQVFALTPPDYHYANNIEELYYWIKTEKVTESTSWGSWYPFINAAREIDSILTVKAASEEYTFTEIMVQSDQKSMQYLFDKENNRFIITIDLPVDGMQTMEERVAEQNETFARFYDEVKIESKVVDINGIDTTLYYYDGGEYLNKETNETATIAPTAMFDLMGTQVTICGVRELYGTEWNDSYLDLFAFSEIQISKRIDPYVDVEEDDWFFDDMEYVYTHSIMKGTEPDVFDPGVSLSRGMIITMLYRQEGEPSVDGRANPFTDVPEDQWYTDAVKWAYENGVVNGMSATTYEPDAPVTRQDLATILYRFSNEVAQKKLLSDKTYDGFDDEDSIADYAKDAVEEFYKASIINGKTKTEFAPKDTATRAEAAAMVHRYLTSLEVCE